MMNLLFVLMIVLSTSLSAAPFPDYDSEITIAWHPWYPYQYTKEMYDSFRPTGLDIEMARVVARAANRSVNLEKVKWSEQFQKLKDGEIDVVMSSLISRKRSEAFLFSNPVRTERSVFYVGRESADNCLFTTTSGMLQYFKTHNLKLGVVEGYVYTDDTVNSFMDNPENDPVLVRVNNEAANFLNLINHKVQGVLSFEIVAASFVDDHGWKDDVQEIDLGFAERPVYYVFNKNAHKLRDAFNRAIDTIKEDGTYADIVSVYLFPILLNQTVNAWWYVWIVIIGTVTYTLYALRYADVEGYNLFGALFIAALFALGGGMLRDIISSREHVFFVADPTFIYLVVGTVLFVYLLIGMNRYLNKATESDIRRYRLKRINTRLNRFFFNHLFMFIDAIGLAAFTVFGVLVALETQAMPLMLWGPILAVITASGGGILVDILLSNRRKGIFYGTFYPEISALWGFVLSAILTWQADKCESRYILAAIVATLSGAFITRLVVMRYDIKGPSFSR